MATCLSLRLVVAVALVAGLAVSLAPATPASADEPGFRTPRVRVAPPPRVHAPVRTVVRTRVICYDFVGLPFDCQAPTAVVYTHGCGGCAPAPVIYQGGCCAAYLPVYAPRYFAAGCGGCAQPVAAPYYWAVRHARYRYAHGYRY
ncbi:MAG: hypothetical protein IT536_15810 [Hyphomicrobiales bacterium]|nr:hypothetical protein [Hyphomicrobiales bacterium]